MAKAEFSASLLQSSVSYDPSEIILMCWFGAQKSFIIIINFENSSAVYFFFFLLFFNEEKVQINSIYNVNIRFLFIYFLSFEFWEKKVHIVS